MGRSGFKASNWRVGVSGRVHVSHPGYRRPLVQIRHLLTQGGFWTILTEVILVIAYYLLAADVYELQGRVERLERRTETLLNPPQLPNVEGYSTDTILRVDGYSPHDSFWIYNAGTGVVLNKYYRDSDVITVIRAGEDTILDISPVVDDTAAPDTNWIPMPRITGVSSAAGK